MPAGQYSANSTKITVDYLLKQPQVLSRRFTQDISDKGFITEALLQGGFPVVGGTIRYNRDDIILPDEEAGARGYEVVAEGARFPIIGPLEPSEQVVMAQKHGLRMFITEEMRLRNQLPQVERRLRELKNELIVYVDSLFMSMFQSDVNIPSFDVTAASGFSGSAWNVANTAIYRDIAVAKAKMTALRRGIKPDTLLVHDEKVPLLETHPSLLAPFSQSGASSPIFTGQMPNKLMGLDVLYSPFVTSGTAIVLQRKALGGYGDERPQYLVGPDFDRATERHWFQAMRQMAYFIDEPKAAVKLTGIGA